MKVFLVIWSVIVVIAVVLIGMSVTKDQVYQGENIIIKTANHDIQIETTSTKIEIEGVSNDYFQLKKTEEILYSIPKTPPLGHDNENYFVLEKQQISEGKWTVKQGESINIQIKSDKNMIIICTHSDKFAVWFLLSFLGVIVWALIAAFAYYTVFE